MANTTNFNWETPDDTDLVKDGAAAIRTLGNSIDTSFVDLKGGTTGQVLSKASNTDLDFTWTADASGIPATIFDAKGDIIAASAADTAARLAVGANDTVLTADSSTATGLKWASPSSGKTWTLLNTGGTALTGAATITISGISGKDDILLFFTAASAGASSGFQCIINGDSGNNYNYSGPFQTIDSTYSASNFQTQGNVNYSGFNLAKQGTNAGNQAFAGILLSGCKSGNMVATVMGAGQGTLTENWFYHGVYDGSAALTSIAVTSGTGNFDNGTVYVWGA
jgi:hypothetical protein